MSNKAKHLYEFNDFRFDAESLCLTYKNEEIRLPLKSLETLKILLENRGEIIERDFLLQKIWTDSYVEDSNLTVTVSQLRKTLARYDKAIFVETLPKRGYRFTNDVREIVEETETPLVIEKHTLERLTIEEQDLNGNHLQPKLFPKPKNFRRFAIIGVLLIVLFSIGGWFYWKNFTGSKIESLAVLPLKNLNETEETKPLAYGLTDNLINRLGSLNRFVVRPFSSVAKYEQSGKDAIKFGEDLGVDAVLEGTIQQVENRLRINVRLISVKNNSQIWEGNFDETEADLLKLQDKISTQVTRSLVSRLTENDQEKVTEVMTQNKDAYEAYLRGRYFAEKRKGEDLLKAISYFQKAIEFDKRFAEAYVELADAQFLMFYYRWDTSPEYANSAKGNLLRALALKSNIPNAFHTLGLIQSTYEWDWESAENSFRKALELAPNSSQALHRYGVFLTIQRKFPEAKEKLEKARQLDPFSVSIEMSYGSTLMYAKELEKAEIPLKQALEIDPKFTSARWQLGRCYWLENRKDEAIAEFMQAMDDYGQTDITKKMRENHGSLPEKVKIWYDEWKILWDAGYADGHNMAFSSAFLEDKELTLSWLEKSVENQDNWAAWIYAEPEFDFVRDNPRFVELMKKMKFQ